MLIVSRKKLFRYNRGGYAIQLPDYVLDALDIEQGDKIDFLVNGHKVEIRKAVTANGKKRD